MSSWLIVSLCSSHGMDPRGLKAYSFVGNASLQMLFSTVSNPSLPNVLIGEIHLATAKILPYSSHVLFTKKRKQWSKDATALGSYTWRWQCGILSV